MRRVLIAGNWKMNGLLADAQDWVVAMLRHEASLACEKVLCPPATLLSPFGALLAGSGWALGAQDCHVHPSGAHTGDIAAPMIKDLGASHVIVGHSERRADHFETSAVVRQKAIAALAAGLTPILCVGETGADREAGRAEAVVAEQLRASLPETDRDVVIAYEPIWAIGSGVTPEPAEIQALHRSLRGLLPTRQAETRILYGGSVNPGNAAKFLALADVDGALVGGASLNPDSFWPILLATAACQA